ncbi:tlde1 domain-containing protein [Rahnella variigena]|jgi:hypothetical protein|uniref:DUF2778 domain-containing protein n=1 Tax=Rahnella variigena TaxID=574964 RepID=A0ABX9Q122_9GAMM|nr:tlde1 domain-containing protein [Rahnella variigena]RJT51582.1 DUF2778 domain-containing protein [Rahnella variigena]RKF70664.1 DUF2778 domain-containing protein [Rahnella variigena]
MTWTYKQSTGELFHDGVFIEKGYSGVLTNKNNPDRQHVKGMGPLPQGSYRVGIATSSKGPLTIELHQTSGESYGRSLFRIHGERREGPAGFASTGCIIMSNPTRRLIRGTSEVLEVVR